MFDTGYLGSFLSIIPCRLLLFVYLLYIHPLPARLNLFFNSKYLVNQLDFQQDLLLACSIFCFNNYVIYVMNMYLLNAWTLIYQFEYSITEGCLDELMWVCMENICLSKMSKQVVIFNSRGALLVAGDEFYIPATKICLLGVQVNSNDETIETQYFCED